MLARLRHFYGTSLGKKAVVAVTGVVLFGFVVAHMAGNLKSFRGNDADGVPKIDVYGHFLRTVGEPVFGYGELLWAARVFLLVALVLHVVGIVQLTAINRAARPARYVKFKYEAASWPARLMLVSGVLLFAFVVFHILHFTTGTVDPARFTVGAAYENLSLAFSVWYYFAIYLVAMVLLALHVYHGVWSLFQTLGIDSPDRNRFLRLLAAASAVILLVGFSAVPVLFFLGDMPPAPSQSSPALAGH